MDFPIVVMSFNRPEYLEQVLRSLKAQAGVAIRDDQVHLFQDGAVSALTGKVYAKQEDIDASRRIFSDIFPGGVIHEADNNLGVALNFDRAERFVFETLNAEVAIFLEDDLVLGPYYLSTLVKLSRIALARDDIGYFAAYGVHRAPRAAQMAFASDLVALEHNWAFGLTRNQWLKSKPYIDQYLDVIRQADYRDRPHDQVKTLFASWGAAMAGSSQDVAKTIACSITGSSKINTYAAFGKYIGEIGLHFNSAVYNQLGYGKTEVIIDDAFSRDSISDAELNQFKSVLKTFVTTGASRKPRPVHARTLSAALYGKDPYEGFEPTVDQPILQGWNGDHLSLKRQVARLRPDVIVDLGAWLGQSTTTLAQAQTHVAPDGVVIAVDTFLGSPEHWSIERTDVRDLIQFRHGRPNFYETFLSNMILLGLNERVFPLAQTTVHAAGILKKHHIRADLVHLDAHHTYEEVLRDMSLYWDLLAPGGVLMGDDFQFPGVSRAVVHFTDRLGLPYTVDFPKWWVAKPG